MKLKTQGLPTTKKLMKKIRLVIPKQVFQSGINALIQSPNNVLYGAWSENELAGISEKIISSPAIKTAFINACLFSTSVNSRPTIPITSA